MSTWKPALKPIINTNDTNTNTNNNTNDNASTTTSGSTWANANKPTTPTSELSEKVQSAQAGILQHHYVRAQLHVLNNNEESIIKETIEAMREHMPNGHKSKEGKLKADFEHMTMRLQRADLTINFNAGSWFMEPNNYDSYTQMYERAVRTVNGPAIAGAKQMRLTDSKVNKAVDRVTTDDRVTFNQGMMSGNSGIGRIMSPGKLIIPLVDAREGEFESTNPYFNPKSKQVFAALNYGRRPHGASTYYGHSYMVLNPKFKINAIYFAGDTFGLNAKFEDIGFNDQVSYQLLGAAYLKANKWLKKDIHQSCILDGELSDTSGADQLLEAHLFESLTFSGNVEAIFISGKDMDKKSPSAVRDYKTIQTNARNFADRHGASLFFID